MKRPRIFCEGEEVILIDKDGKEYEVPDVVTGAKLESKGGVMRLHFWYDVKTRRTKEVDPF